MLDNVNMDLISVIVPVYNVADYLPKCIDSIINQTYHNLDIILVDDGSKDNSGKICDDYSYKDSRIRVIHKENGGVSSARNIGLDVAKGDYISFIDPDDYIDVNTYKIFMSEMKAGDFDIIECNFYNVYNDHMQIAGDCEDKLYLDYHDIIYGAFTYYLFFGVPNKFFKKSVIGDTRFMTKFQVAEDMLFFMECAKKNIRLKYIKSPLYYYFQRHTSVMNKPFHKGSFDVLRVLEIIKPDYDDKKLSEAYNFYYLQKAIQTLKNIVITGKFCKKRFEMRKIIVDNRKWVFKSKPFSVCGGVQCFGKADKLYVLLVWLCPVLVYMFHPIYLFLRKHLQR